jgi:chromosome segregation ATPase
MRKLALVALGVVAVAFALSYTNLGSYAGTAWSKLRSGAKKQVPIEFEIDRLKREVTQLSPDMKKNRSIVAEEMVAIDNLKEEITATRTRLAQQKANMLELTKAVDNGESTFVSTSGVTYSRDRIVQKLARDLESCKRCESELKTKEQLLDAKERALDAARTQLGSMHEQKQELEVAIAKLEADLKNVRLAETRCKFQLDDSRLSEIKRSLSEVKGRIKAAEKAVELEAEFPNDPTVISHEKTVRPAGDVTREIREYVEGAKVAEKK